MSPILKKHRQQLIDLAKDNNLSYLALFGSQARGEQEKDSDIDVLVDFIEAPGFVELYNLEEGLKKVFDKKVDMVTKGGLNKYLKPYIDKDLEVVYERA